MRPDWSSARRVALALCAPALLVHCALFFPTRSVSAEVALPTWSAGAASARHAVVASPNTPAPAPSLSEVAAARRFRMRRRMLVAVASVRVAEREGAFEVLRRLIARRGVRVLDLSRASGLTAKVHAPVRERSTTLEGPWIAERWAAHWSGAAYLLVSESIQIRPTPPSSDCVAEGRFRLIATPGGEAVWAARLDRRGTTEHAALSSLFDALVDALHGTLRDDPETPAQPVPVGTRRQRRSRSHHRRSHRR